MLVVTQLWVYLVAVIGHLPPWMLVLLFLSLFLNLMQGIYRVHCFIEKRKKPGSEEEIAGDG